MSLISEATLKIALIGNPNCGKSSLFNHLTGLNQKIGNFPGVTVDKKTGYCALSADKTAEILDLPGTYSIYPRSLDEKVVFGVLSNPEGRNYPDLVVVVVDASNLKRNLLLFTQIKDLKIPVVLALNMMDVAINDGKELNIKQLEVELGASVVPINARLGTGLDKLKAIFAHPPLVNGKWRPVLNVKDLAPELIDEISAKFNLKNDYQALQYAHQVDIISALSEEDKGFIQNLKSKYNFKNEPSQIKETISRYNEINKIISKVLKQKDDYNENSFSSRLDKILTHKIFGYLIFFLILFVVFQAIFAWAELPMDLIDLVFSKLSTLIIDSLPSGPLTELLAEGIVPGLGGVLIFIPQIAILFAFISILEESGYMARVVFLMDKIMRKFGLNGKSVVPLISGVACAIPAIMATRSIDDWKDRIITIFVTPLMSCSARLPIYTILIALVVPDYLLGGIINLQGLVLMGMYLLGFVAAILSALLMKFLLKSKAKGYFMMEMPIYRMPRWKNVGFTIVEKVKAFVFEAGKVIVAISIILWVLASYGSPEKMDQAEEVVSKRLKNKEIDEDAFNNEVSSYKLEHSFAGIFGKAIEPVIEPLGFDWKIGIALITSFAAREVFVGTMATIYSVGGDVSDDHTIKSRMKAEINNETGGPRYTTAMAFSLLVFYAFAMQCMSTLAIVYRETKGWKWPLLQFLYMSGMAYLASFVVYNVFS